MDPVSFLASVVSLAALVAETIQITKSYVKQVKDAKKDAIQILNALEVLHHNLSRLDKLLKADTAGSFTDTSILVTSTHACRVKIGSLSAKLGGTVKGPFERLRWPLNKQDHKATLQDIQNFADWIQFAVTIDGCALLSKTSGEVMKLLSDQLQMTELLDGLINDTQITHEVVLDIQEAIRDSGLAEEREKALRSITETDPEQRHRDVKHSYVKNTGQWLLQDPRYMCWQEQACENPTGLWCHGSAGSGKSMLASVVIDHLRVSYPNELVAVAHYHFDYKDEAQQSPRHVISCLLKQVASGHPGLPQPVAALYNDFGKKGKAAPQSNLLQVLHSTCQEYSRVFFVFDALDECKLRSTGDYVELIVDLQRSYPTFVTSRPLPDKTRETFQLWPQIEIKARDSDMRTYVIEQINRRAVRGDIDDELREKIAHEIVARAQHM
ncbi:MAG: hypothetical protein Q9218_003637 [Villophora microphyllina]